MIAQLYEIKEQRDKYHVFKDRFHAGKTLSRMLESNYREDQDAMVLAIPAGGVPVSLEISKKLKVPFDLIIVRKIPIPDNPEAGFGAVTIEGSIFLNHKLLAHLGLRPSQVENQIASVKEDLKKRNVLFRDGKPLPDLLAHTVILVDDSLASGYTMIASIDSVRNKGAKKIVVAIPTAPLSSIKRILSLVNEIYCANIRETPYFAVADAYKIWYDFNHEDVLSLLKKEALIGPR